MPVFQGQEYDTLQPDHGNSYRQVDFGDVLRQIRSKIAKGGLGIDGEKYTPHKVHFSVVPAIGYSLQTGLAAVLSGNVAYRNSTLKDQKLSSVLASLNYTQYKQFILPLQANIWSKGNKYNIVIDWRFMKYPSITYGLGGKTSPSDAYSIDFSYLKFHETIFKSVATNMYAGLGYYLDYLWNIKEIDLSPNTKTLFQNYELTSKEIASGIALRVLYDSRLNQINPDNGFYANIVYRPNFTFMGSHSNWQSMLFEFRKYIKLPTKRKNVFAFWSYNWLTTGGKPPYLLLPSTGWDDPFNTGRGYIQGRYRGRNMFYLEAEYRFDILRNGFLGGVVFANAQSFSNVTYSELTTIAPGWGGGLRIKLNKESGSNLCIDYGFGLNGSRGFFVNLNEVF
jgi:outer membrane protein assembly factor BamA